MLVRASGFTAGLPSHVLCYENAAPERWIFVLGRKAYEHLSFEIELEWTRFRQRWSHLQSGHNAIDHGRTPSYCLLG